MKLAALSDIHGNLPALRATVADIDAWRPDQVVVNGDIVNDGPNSRACWRLIRQRRDEDGWIVLRGNHEEYVSGWLDPALPREGPAYELMRVSHWTYRQMNGQVAELAALPEHWNWTAPDGSTIVVMHGSLAGVRAGIYPFTSDEEMWRRVEPGAAVFVTAHTHIPFARAAGGIQVVNVGSVGAPGDGDGRAAYGRLTWTRAAGWRAEIARVAYDRAEAERDFYDSGFMAEAGPEVELSLSQFRLMRDVRTLWAANYRERILSGALSVADSIHLWLNSDEFRRYLTHFGSGTAVEQGDKSLIPFS
jgi:predicted phosphodiesterase